MIIDTHIHLDATQFTSDLDAVIDRARATGIQAFITIGTSPESNRRALALTEKYPDVWAAVGLHPHEAERWDDRLATELESLINHPRVVAIGETGLDFYRNHASPNAQRRAFVGQLAIARRQQLPVIIHARNAYPQVLDELEVSGVSSVIMHCFTGDQATAQRCITNGWYIAFGGAATYPSNSLLQDIIRQMPIDRLLLETDAPYLPPQPFRGQRNEPAWLLYTLTCCARVRSLTPSRFGEQLVANTTHAFPRLVAATLQQRESQV